MANPEFTDWEFELEAGGGFWWAALHVDGGIAIGKGETPWIAIAVCIEDIKHTLDISDRCRQLFTKLQAGELQCSQCKAPIKPLGEDNPCVGLFFCGTCEATHA